VRRSCHNIIGLILAATVFLANVAYGEISGPDFSFVVTREGDSIRTEARVDLAVAPALVWAVLTEYERYPRFISSMRDSRIVSRNLGGLVVEQKGRFSFLFFSQDIEARMLVSEFPPNIIESSVLEGNFKVMNGRYELLQVGDNTRISFSGRLIPKFSLPPVFGKSIVRSVLLRNFNELIAEILRRDAETRLAPRTGR
jgi:ribosome-associated toxin RatA of RatAB toxin-antitoxin module